MVVIKNQIQGLRYSVVSVWECSHPELSTKQLIRKFVPHLHYIVYDFKAVLVKKNLSVNLNLI